MSLARSLFLIALLIGCLAAAHAAVVINELFYDPTGTDTNKEFIELYNNGTADADLTGWQIQWGGTNYAYGIYNFPAGTIIHAQDYLLIGGDSTATMFGVVPDLISRSISRMARPPAAADRCRARLRPAELSRHLSLRQP